MYFTHSLLYIRAHKVISHEDRRGYVCARKESNDTVFGKCKNKVDWVNWIKFFDFRFRDT